MGNSPARGPQDYFRPGDWNAICSICGTKMKAGDAEKNWQGLWRHWYCNEPRPAQDFVHSTNAKEMVVPWIQKLAEIDVEICTMNGISAIAGYATAGCMLAGRSQLGDMTPSFTVGKVIVKLQGALVTGPVVLLTWTTSVNIEPAVVSYTIFRSVNGGAFAAFVTVPNLPKSYNDGALASSSTYSYYVVANLDSGGSSDPSNTVTEQIGIIEVYVNGTYTWHKRTGMTGVDVLVIGSGQGGGGGDNSAPGVRGPTNGYGAAAGGLASASFLPGDLPSTVTVVAGALNVGTAADINVIQNTVPGADSYFGGTPGSNPGFYVWAEGGRTGNGGSGQILGGTNQVTGQGGQGGNGGQGITSDIPPGPIFPGSPGTHGAPGGGGAGAYVLINGSPPGLPGRQSPPGAPGIMPYAGGGGIGGSGTSVPGGPGAPGGLYGGGGGGGGLALNPTLNGPGASGAGGDGGIGVVVVLTRFS